ncbi:uncharacterized protein LOC127800092 [Diospyros lotus]|uniref:uncharacterized protein LOC127800092 n=1 Tax=Diospyros lotus TaxID=55363 RepID=UPI00224EE282|nr:uncharacterized protein LOC127800092 [Diospyros lotus]
MDGYGHAGRPGSRPDTACLIRTSEHYLRKRILDGCRSFALQAQESDPGNTAAAQILAVADVLKASETRFNGDRPDWYAVLGVTRYSDDRRLIGTRFRSLASLLNPNKNKFASAGEAFGLVRDAWTVLSSPSGKTQFDNELRMVEGRTKIEGQHCGSGDGATFWTVCPYCYYVYEYSKVYQEHCLRCQNRSCGRGFHATPIPSPPPPAVAGNGQYWCLGFSPVAFASQEQGKGFSSWSPFGTVFRETEEKGASNGDRSCPTPDPSTVVVNATDQTEEGNLPKPARKRMKTTAARNSRKIMGRGTRVKRDETVSGHSQGQS